MANLIIKSSADNLVLQGSDASPAITVGATGTTSFAENVTMSGTANNIGTTTAGTYSGSFAGNAGLATAKAWVNFDGTGTPAARTNGSYNVSSIGDRATGKFTVNFTTDMANTAFAVAALAGNASTDDRTPMGQLPDAVGSVNIDVKNLANSFYDVTFVSAIVFGA